MDRSQTRSLRMSTDSNAKIFSMVGGCRRSGRWLVPAKTNMMTLFGHAVIDLRDARTSADELEFTCLSVFANITFIVPEGAEIRPSGMAILGSSKSTVPISGGSCDLPPISAEATTIIGRLRIRTTEEVPDHDLSRRQRRRQLKIQDGSIADDPPEATASPALVISDPEPQMSEPGAPRDLSPELAIIPPEAMTPKADLSSPITAFQPSPAEDQSLIHDVDVPASIEGTMLESEPQSDSDTASVANALQTPSDNQDPDDNADNQAPPEVASDGGPAVDSATATTNADLSTADA